MNRIDRLFAILLQLQTRERLRAEDLAAAFGISKRTVYRDMAALTEMGVPVVSLPGEGYELMPGYFLPPLVLTADEASAVLLGTQMLIHQANGRLIPAAEQARTKIAHALPARTQRQVDQLTAVIRFYRETAAFDLDDARLVELQQAALDHHVVALSYFGPMRDDLTTRDVEPEALAFANGAWYLNAYCRLRQAPRTFRLDRIERYRVTAEPFVPRRVERTEPPTLTVRIRFTPVAARWARERQHFAFVGETAAGDDVIMTYAVTNLRQIMPWLLGWGSAAEPLEPPELREQLAAEARRMVEMLT
jgi:predicted DNA-binding transcriptional regulator YafY